MALTLSPQLEANYWIDRNAVVGALSSDSSGWNSWTDSVANNFVGNQRAQSATLATHFVNFQNPAVLATTDTRLNAASPYSVHCTSGCDTQLVTTDGTDPGADQDLVETLTNGVNTGLPELARRWSVSVAHAGTTAYVRAVNTSTLTLKVSTHPSMKSTYLVYNSNSPTDLSGFKTFNVTGLTQGVRYWYTLSDGVSTVKDKL